MKNEYYKIIGSVFYDINDNVVFYVWIRQCPDSHKKNERFSCFCVQWRVQCLSLYRKLMENTNDNCMCCRKQYNSTSEIKQTLLFQ